MTDPFAMPTAEPQDKLSGEGGVPFVPLSAIAGNRLVLIVPVEFERSVDTGFKDDKTDEPKFGPLLTADIAVLSGEGQFVWDGKDENGSKIERTYEVEIIPGQTAAVFEGVYIRSAPLVDKTEDARRVDKPQTMTVGRLRKPKAYNLANPSDTDMATARKWLATEQGKAFMAKAQEMHEARVAASKGEASKDATPFS